MRGAIFLVCAGFAWAQAITIRGIVLELPTQAPIPGATVKAAYKDGDSESGPTAYTDAQGAFTLQLPRAGDVEISAQKDGYSGSGVAATVYPLSASTTRTIRMILFKPSSLTGLVVDETSAPIPNAAIQFWSTSAESPIGSRTTDDHGAFSLRKAPADSYVAQIVGIRPSILEASADGDRVEYSPRDSFWPGGTDSRASALPLSLAPGTAGDFGTLRAEKVPHYRVRVRTPKADCETLGSLTILGGDKPTRLTIECAREFVVAGLAPGSYRFGLLYGIESQQWALETVDVRREGQIVEMSLAPMGRVEGRLVAAEGASLDGLDRIYLALQPEPAALPTLIPDAQPDAEGRFEYATVAWPLHRLVVTLLNPGFYVQSIRAGRGDGLVSLSPGGTSPIEVVIDNQVAMLNGSVDGAEFGAGDDTVVMLLDGRSMVASNGQFTFRNLPPGEYRPVALSREAARELTRNPALHDRLASQVAPVTLKRGKTKTIQLRLSQLPR